MGHKKKFLALLSFTLVSQGLVFAKAERQAVSAVEAIQKNAMPLDRIASFAVKGKMNTCRAYYNNDAAYYYSLFYIDQNGQEASELFGPRNPLKTISFTPSAGQKKPSVESSKPDNSNVYSYSDSDRKTAKNMLGQRVKELLLKERCGSPKLTTQQLSFNDLNADQVQFYKEGKKIVCTSKDFNNEVYDSQTCSNKSFPIFLPDPICRFLYQAARGVDAKGKMSWKALQEPKAESVTSDQKVMAATDKALRQNPELAEEIMSARILEADYYIPSSMVTVLQNKNLDKNFSKLDTSTQMTLASLVLSLERINGNSMYPQPSEGLLKATLNNSTFMKSVKLFILSRPDEKYTLAYIPTIEEQKYFAKKQFSVLATTSDEDSKDQTKCQKNKGKTPIAVSETRTEPQDPAETPSDSVVKAIEDANFNLVAIQTVTLTIPAKFDYLPAGYKAFQDPTSNLNVGNNLNNQFQSNQFQGVQSQGMQQNVQSQGMQQSVQNSVRGMAGGF